MLYKRQEANGVKRSKHYVVKTPHSSQAILDAKQHSISYTLSRNHAVIVEYCPDEDTDMFQVNAAICMRYLADFEVPFDMPPSPYFTLTFPSLLAYGFFFIVEN